MDSMNGGTYMHAMGGDGGMAIVPSPMNDTIHNHHMMMKMHMTFFWGKNAEILFDGWPGYNRPGMYALALVFVFSLAVLVEWLSHCSLIREGTNHIAAGLIQTAMYTVRIGLAYMVMLAVMSFNAGVFLVAVAGHALGFLVFGSRVFKKQSSSKPPERNSVLPQMSC